MNIDPVTLQMLIEKIKAHAEINDRTELFPKLEFGWIRETGLLSLPLNPNLRNVMKGQTSILLNVLQQLGSVSLPVGRIYEGHVNALQLIDSFGSAEQRRSCFDSVYNKQLLFGVWNTEMRPEGVKIHHIGNGKYRLEGAKTFCSGGNWIQQPLITGKLLTSEVEGWQMCIIPERLVTQITPDPQTWRPMGMQSTASYKMDFSGIVIDQKDLLGPPNAYYQQPAFTGGAIRYCAIQMGASQAILQETHQFMRSANRTKDPFQQARMAIIAAQIETGKLWMEKASILLDNWEVSGSNEQKLLAYINMTRTVVREICEKCMQLAEMSVGVSALLKPHPLERIHRDLSTYLKQAAPDEALVAVGKYIFEKECVSRLWEKS